MSIFDSIQNERQKEIDARRQRYEKQIDACMVVDGMVRSVLKDLKKSQAGKRDFAFFDSIFFDDETFSEKRWILGSGLYSGIQVSVTAQFNKENKLSTFLVKRNDKSDWLGGWNFAEIECGISREELEQAILKVYE